MEKSCFFNSVNGDRRYFAESFRNYFKMFFKNGIFNNSLKVVSSENMTINLSIGNAFIEGAMYENDSIKQITLSNADSNQSRIDTVVIRYRSEEREIKAEVIEGSYSTNPVPPAITRTNQIYDLRIANITVPAGTINIDSNNIEDTRFSAECGDVVSTIQQISTSEIYDQLTASFLTWFNNIKNQLSTDSAGNLQNQINDITNVTEGLQNQINDVNSTTSNLQNLVNQKTSIHLLWTNSNPDSMPKNTNIELANNDYDFLLIFYDHTSSAFENGTLTPKGKNAMLFAIGLSSGQTARRNLTYIDDTHYQSSVPYVASSENSAACVPYQIYGIKFE